MLTALFLLCSQPGFAQSSGKAGLLRYIHEKLAKPDGGYGWEDQHDSHLTPTYAVIGVLHHLDHLPADRASLIQFVRLHHPQRGANREAGPSGTELRNLVYQQMQAIAWLGGDLSGFEQEVNGWQSQAHKRNNYERQGNPVLYQEMMTPVCKSLLGSSLREDQATILPYLRARRRPNGSFNNAPTRDGGDGNILNTYWSLYALKLLSQKDSLRKETVTWLQACQVKSGGFTHQPHPQLGANDEVAYTWAAVQALHLLGAAPERERACIDYLLSLRNADGGFGNQPGRPSDPMATFYAVEALQTLGALTALDKKEKPHPGKPEKEADLSGLKVYTVQFEASGSGSPAEAVMLADSLQIHLWGAKNATPDWIRRAQHIAAKRKVPVVFFPANEPYGKDIHVPGMGTFGHILDHIAPPGMPPVAFPDSAAWQDVRKGPLQILLQADGGLILQVSNNEPMARILLDESIRNGGYVAISTIHFGQNFAFFLPYLYPYRHQLPFVALQDAHGQESWWWGKELSGYRTLFLAREPTYQEMRKALQNNWVVAARHDSISNYQTRLMGGTEQVRQFIRSRQPSWRWWPEGKSTVNHPWAAITVVHPSDSFEVARPEQGVNLRVRCLWAGTRQMLREPYVKLDQLTIDQVPVAPAYLERRAKNGQVEDAYYWYNLPRVSPGTHTVEATFRHLKENAVRKVNVTFTCSGSDCNGHSVTGSGPGKTGAK